MMFGWKKKVDKAAWAEAIYQKRIAHPEYESDEKLTKLTSFMLEQHHRILMESVQIARTTKYADTKQSRADLCQKHYHEMLKLKPFCNREQLTLIQEAEEAIKML